MLRLLRGIKSTVQRLDSLTQSLCASQEFSSHKYQTEQAALI